MQQKGNGQGGNIVNKKKQKERKKIKTSKESTYNVDYI